MDQNQHTHGNELFVQYRGDHAHPLQYLLPLLIFRPYDGIMLVTNPLRALLSLYGGLALRGFFRHRSPKMIDLLEDSDLEPQLKPGCDPATIPFRLKTNN